MNRWIRFLGLAGLILLLFGALGLFFVGGNSSALNALIFGHLAFGALAIVVWFALAGAKSLSAGGMVFTSRGTRFAGGALLYTALVVAVLVFANWLGDRHSKRWDLTEQGVYSLSPQSRQVIEALKKPLQIVAFKASETLNEQELRDLLSYYRDANPGKVSTEIIDPRTKPHLVDTYGMKPGNVLYLGYGEGENKAVSRINEANEESVTNAVLRLTRGEAKKIYYVQGYGQPGLTDASPQGVKGFADAVRDEHLTIEPIILAEKGSVPEDAAVVVLASPRQPMLESERKTLLDYADKGGHLLLLADPRTSDDVVAIADHYGIEVGRNLVVDLVARLFAAPALGADILVQDFGAHSITRNLSGDTPVILSMTSSVRPKAPGAEYADILRSSPSAWAETNLDALFNTGKPSASKDPEDLKGPVTLAVAYEKKLDGGAESGDEKAPAFQRATRVVVFGTSTFIQNERLGYYANRDLILNVLNWLSGEEGGLTIRAKTMRASFAPISRDTYIKIFVSSLLIPELILLMGLAVWWRRRTSESL